MPSLQSFAPQILPERRPRTNRRQSDNPQTQSHRIPKGLEGPLIGRWEIQGAHFNALYVLIRALVAEQGTSR